MKLKVEINVCSNVGLWGKFEDPLGARWADITDFSTTVGVRTCGRDNGKEDFPDEGEEVHDVVAARRHLLLALLALLLVLVVSCEYQLILAYKITLLYIDLIIVGMGGLLI